MTSTGKESFFHSCLLTLQDWLFSLPRELKIRPSDRSDTLSRSPHVFVLHMIYHTALILLAKPLVPSKIPQGPGQAQTDNSPISSPNIGLRALRICREAATEISHIGDLYRQQFGSFRRSPLTATHCTLMACLVNLYLFDKDIGGTSLATTGLTSCMLTLYQLGDSWTPPRRYWENLKKTVDSIQQGGKTAGKKKSRSTKARIPEKRDHEPQPSSVLESMVSGASTSESPISDAGLVNGHAENPYPNAPWSLDGMDMSMDYGKLDLSVLSSLPWDYALESSGMDFWS